MKSVSGRGLSDVMVEVWTHLTAAPRAIADEARIAEAQGWEGLGVVDSQNRSGDP